MGKIGFCDHCKKATTILKPHELKKYTLCVDEPVLVGHEKIKKEIKFAELCDECYNKIALIFEMSDEPIMLREPKPDEATTIDKSTIKLKPGTKTHHRWTEEEDELLMNPPAGTTNNDLACKFGVTLAAVTTRRSKLYNKSKGFI